MSFPPGIFAGQRFAVVGLGRMGLPAARALLAMGADVVVWDDNPAARAAAAADGFTVADPATSIDIVVQSPSFNMNATLNTFRPTPLVYKAGDVVVLTFNATVRPPPGGSGASSFGSSVAAERR